MWPYSETGSLQGEVKVEQSGPRSSVTCPHEESGRHRDTEVATGDRHRDRVTRPQARARQAAPRARRGRRDPLQVSRGTALPPDLDSGPLASRTVG